MIMICPIFFLLKEVGTKQWNVSLESWEHWGDYIIGASMVVIAVYFVLAERTYLEQQEDGSYVAKACSCHSSSAEHQGSGSEEDCNARGRDARGYFNCATRRGKKQKRPIFTGEEAVPPLPDESDLSQDSSGQSQEEAAPLIPKGDAKVDESIDEQQGRRQYFVSLRDVVAFRDVQGAVVGALQGFCCPMGMAGLGFMGHVSATASPLMLLLFAVVFVMASACGSGVITLGWGYFSSRGMGGCLSPRVMYHVSCVLTFILGISWILCNATGVLHHINFAEKIHQRIHDLHTHDMRVAGLVD